MAKNGKVGDGHRNGQIDKRSQALNPKIDQYVKTSGGKFKGVRKEN
jgi:hypothetical protein